MSDLSQADRYLLEQIRQGSAEGWSQLVQRYQGRLTAFAQRKIGNVADAEDLVQDTFLSFLRGLESYREQAGVETYLFTILRRKIIDTYRGKNLPACSLQEAMAADRSGPLAGLSPQLAASDPTASWYVRRDEDDRRRSDALSEALENLVRNFQASKSFEDLKLADLLFYAQLRNKDIAAIMQITEQKVGLFKHRCLNRIRDDVARRLEKSTPPDAAVGPTDEASDMLLTRTWEEQRFSCPKRRTLGAYLLKALDEDWRQYITFHLEKLGCRFCQANLEDLKAQNAAAAGDVESERFRQQIFDSTVGFLNKI